MSAASQNSAGHAVFSRVTGAGVAGIATLLLDGDEALMRLERVFVRKGELQVAGAGRPRPINDGAALFGRIVDLDGRAIDEVVVAALNAKSSPTGNPQVELSCHGGEGVLAAIETALLDAGFARARATELLERAHLNGKLSLIALEARIRLANAVTARQAEFLLCATALKDRWERHGFDMALGLREKRSDWRPALIRAAEEALAAAKHARALLQRHTLAIIGPVNAGKSTLANLLARADRHIVSATPGTTRDRLDTPLDILGLHVLLSDTAGLQPSDDPVELEGQRRARAAANEAALRAAVIDGSRAPQDSDIDFLKETAASGPMIFILNKKDLGLDETAAGLGFVIGQEPVAISAQTGEGLDALEAAIEARLLGPAAAAALVSGAPFTSRQVQRLEEFRAGLLDDQHQHGMDVIVHLRKLIGTRPDPHELAQALKL